MAKKPTGGFKHWAAAGFKDTLLRCQMKKGGSIDPRQTKPQTA